MRTDLAEQVQARLGSWGSHPVYVYDHAGCSPTVVSADSFSDLVRQTESLLRGARVRPGFPVAFMLENSPLFVAVLLAILALDAVPLPLQVEYKAMELDEIVSNARPQALIVERGCLKTAAPYAGNRTLIIASGQSLAVERTGFRYEGAIPLDPQVGALVYTYRGLGYPLGALLPPGQLMHGVSVIQEVMGAAAGEVVLGMLPMGHIFGMVCCVFLPLISRLTCVIPRSLHPRLVLQNLKEHHVTCAVSVPEVFDLLQRFGEPGSRFPQLRLLISGGSLLSESNYEEIRRFFRAELAHGYGLTEFTPVSRNIPGQTRPGTVGPVCRGVEVRIRAGEIEVRARDMARGYHRRPTETAAAFEGSWFRTGDRGKLSDGHLVFVEELKRTRKVNGRMVDLNEVERAILSFPGVRAADVSLDGPNLLQARVALGEDTSEDDSFRLLRQHLAEKIAAHKIPKRLIADHER